MRKLFHGLNGDDLSQALGTGTLVPDGNNEIYFDYTSFANCFVHGADRTRGRSFVIGVEVELSNHHYRMEEKPGNPTTLIVTTIEPLPVSITELYVRSGTRDEGFAVARYDNPEDFQQQLLI